jgi:hypothetical protein
MSKDGLVKVPRDKAGIGVDVNVARVDSLTVRTQVIRNQ